MLTSIVAIVLLVAPVLPAPSTNATCTAEAWSFNSRGQSPCLVGAYLIAPCRPINTPDILPALKAGEHYYIGASNANNCVCNSVMWNLMSACGLCQTGGASITWTEYKQPCPDSMIAIGQYPVPLPADIAVPSWAYYDFTIANVFNVAIASQQSGIESSAASGPTSTPAPVPKPTVGSSSNTGAIVGGVVGGVLGICIIGLIAFILVRKRRPEEPTTNYPQPSHQPPMRPFNAAAPMTGPVPSHQFGAPSPPVSTTEYKSYNPSHPSVPGTPGTGHYIEPVSYPYQPQGVPGQAPHPRVPEL